MFSFFPSSLFFLPFFSLHLSDFSSVFQFYLFFVFPSFPLPFIPFSLSSLLSSCFLFPHLLSFHAFLLSLSPLVFVFLHISYFTPHSLFFLLHFPPLVFFFLCLSCFPFVFYFFSLLSFLSSILVSIPSVVFTFLRVSFFLSYCFSIFFVLIPQFFCLVKCNCAPSSLETHA